MLVDAPAGHDSNDNNDISETSALAAGNGLRVVGVLPCRRGRVNSSLLISTGKADQLCHMVKEQDARLVVFNGELNPRHERNMEKHIGCRVIDRTTLILDIFARRARSYEGKLQVELAQLRHLSSRLIRGWSHLERQRGGIGLRGPGETQLETDRRLINQRMKHIKRRLRCVEASRRENRRPRQQSGIPVVALAGYTNTGKSTLFNRLTKTCSHTADKPFATLDPLLRRCCLRAGRYVMLADTVGFVRNLPDGLLTAFRATLEETCQADLILHVMDVSDPGQHEHRRNVERTLEKIGAGDIPQLWVLNCVDRVPGLEAGWEQGTDPSMVYVSALTGAGRDDLTAAMAHALWGDRRHHRLRLPATAAAARNELYQCGAVLDEVSADDKWSLNVFVEDGWLQELCARHGLIYASMAGQAAGESINKE